MTVTPDRATAAGAADGSGAGGSGVGRGRGGDAGGSGGGWSVIHGVRPMLVSLSRLLRRPLTSYYLIIGTASLLLALGLVMVLSASSVFSYRKYGSTYYVFGRQAMWAAVGLAAAWALAKLPPRWIRASGLVLFISSIGLLLLTYVPGLGVSSGQNRNWIDIGGPFHLQPSEVAKLALVIWAAGVFARKERLLVHWKHLVIPFVPGAFLVGALVLGQGDLGTAAILIATVLVMLWVVGVPARYFVVALALAASVSGYFVMTTQYRMSRVRVLVNPFSDPLGFGYQPIHSMYAFGTGGWYGTGLGGSRQKWGTLPESHTDFIFAVIGEELGLVGSLIVVILFFLLGYAGIRIAWRAPDLYTRLAAAGITGWLLSQALINMATVLGLFPVTGVPLPFVSYGGSAMLPTLAAVGILVSFAKREPGAAAALAARRRRGRFPFLRRF